MAIVTIGIPVYNESDYLDETINSAISQTLSDIEIIVSDNASTDNSFEIANRYSESDPRVRVIRQTENIGAHNNFQFLLSEAKTPYFVWLGGHDVFESDYLEKAVDFLDKDQEAVMVYPINAFAIDKEGNSVNGAKCSNINTTGIEWPLKRVGHIVKNLTYCINIHGIFRTEILRALPFEKVIGPDNLILGLAGIYGHVRGMDIIGLQARQVHIETRSEQKKRWEEFGIFTNEKGRDPFCKLIDSHLNYIKKCKKIGLVDKMLNYNSLQKILHKRYLGL